MRFLTANTIYRFVKQFSFSEKKTIRMNVPEKELVKKIIIYHDLNKNLAP